MTRNKVIAFAHESAEYVNEKNENVFEFTFDELHRAFEAVEAHEREACEADCESVVSDSNSIAEHQLVTAFGKDINRAMAMGASNCLSAIRARAIKETT